MPILYLVRHGEASAEGPDAARVLTEQGAADVERLAQWAARMEISVSEIRHSPRRRAAQTAEIFAGHLRCGVRQIEGIAPNDDVVPFVEEIEHVTEPVMVVGHLPFLEEAVALLTGNERPPVGFHPATLVALRRAADGFFVDFVVYPALI